MDDDITAAMRYKEIVGLARASAENLRSWEVARADELEARLAEAHQAVADAAEREQRAVDRASRWWKMAQHNVEGLTWLPEDEDPAPVPTARPGYLEKYLEEVKPSYQELVQAVLSLGWRAKRS
ncbi:hypothetical protein ACIQUM_34080 [Amycolatopsis azurea]|uniref:Uncharacterized protein n=1 Tax=Amycolatopsis azurea DSM 43854 TaxID=1238180 RepID=M2NJW2_9PSEU|nr:hypothetical protein [Amycolatopsis azurea]EMD22409.1 hypothetical protein C791_8480 [Amycolatopsis azurea DSM 43854]OOC04195.1 hypothetical protein B0293_23320 [Amycolatopsis azurea DSM 43854]